MYGMHSMHGASMEGIGLSLYELGLSPHPLSAKVNKDKQVRALQEALRDLAPPLSLHLVFSLSLSLYLLGQKRTSPLSSMA